MESYTADFFQQCETTLAVHVQLRKLLICEYLVINHLRDRFRLNCRTDLPPSMIQEESIEKILDFLERDGKFSEGNYNFIKEKAADVHVEIIMLIQLAEGRIKEIRANSLMVKTFVTDVDPIHLEKETREEVDIILLAASEKLLCRSEDDDEDASGLWERYQDLNTLSDEFLNIWHKEFCKCRKQYGRRLLLQYVRQGARLLDLGENKFDRFRRNIVPKLLATLKKVLLLHCMSSRTAERPLCPSFPRQFCPSGYLTALSVLISYGGNMKRKVYMSIYRKCSTPMTF